MIFGNHRRIIYDFSINLFKCCKKECANDLPLLSWLITYAIVFATVWWYWYDTNTEDFLDAITTNIVLTARPERDDSQYHEHGFLNKSPLNNQT